MPIYRKNGAAKNGERRWTVVIFSQGQRRDWTVSGTKAEAEAFEARKRVEFATTTPSAVRVVPTLSEFCKAQYRPHAELTLKSTTWYKQKFLVADLISVLGDRKLREVGTPDAAERYARVRLRDGLKPISVNNELRVLRRIVNFARERGMLIPPPRFKMLRERGAGRVKVWADAEVKDLLDACAEKSPSVLPLVVFLLNTGCRKGEALALTWDHIDLKRKLVLVWPGNGWEPKNGKAREVPVSDALLPFLTGKHVSEKWVFPASTRGRYAMWPKLQFDRARKAAGLVGGPHVCRHTFASHFLKKQPDLFLLAHVMGHSDITVTKLYSHLLPEHLERARNAVNFASPIGAAELSARRRWATRGRA